MYGLVLLAARPEKPYSCSTVAMATLMAHGVVVLLLVTASLSAQTGQHPFPPPISVTAGVVTVSFTEFAALPDVDGLAVRIMHLVDEPARVACSSATCAACSTASVTTATP